MQRLQKAKTFSKTVLQHLVSVLVGLLFLTYPFLVYFGLDYFEPRVLYVALGVVLLLRFSLRVPRLTREDLLRVLTPVVAIGLLVVLGVVSNSELYMLFLPALITLSLGGAFGHSLVSGPSMVETFARMEVPDLTDADRRYCWNVTLVWVVFMLSNSALVVVLAMLSEQNTQLAGYDALTVWTVYTGVVSYVLMGVLFALEYLYRKWKFRRFQGSLLDRALREIIPPRGNIIKTFVPLNKLNVHGRRSEYPVARHSSGGYNWSRFNQSVAGVSNELADQPGERWLLDCEDGFAFAVGLFGIWQSDGEAIVPPSDRPDTLRNLLDDADGVVSADPDSFEVDAAIDPLSVRGSYNDLRILDAPDCDLRLFTSGSSGRRESIPKTLEHLRSEVRVLEEVWSDRLGDSRIVSTVSQNHIYGLLFKLLWPLSAGRCFDADSPIYPEVLFDRIDGEGSVALVTTPTHLETFVEHENFTDLGTDLSAVFSSGGPLSAEVAEAVNSGIGQYPLEIFGSTETGGVAWRRQDGDGENPWTPFETVETDVSEEGTLLVKSPHVSQPGTGWHDMRDRVEFRGDGQFVLRGRADRVENIAEKRVDLVELESRAEEYEGVASAGAIAVEETSQSATRRRVKMAVVPTGTVDPSDEDRLGENLRDFLLDSFEPVVVPREFRIVDELPRNAEGKVTVRALRSLFDEAERTSS